jgi:hypothetical protein
MTKWNALAVMLVAIVVLVSVPVGSWLITGAHCVDCGGLDRQTCRQAIDRYSTPRRGLLPDYIGFSIDPHFAGSSNGDYVLYGWVFGRDTVEGQPLC